VGTFDRARLARAIETEKKGQVTWKDVQGTTVYLFREGSKQPSAAASSTSCGSSCGSSQARCGASTPIRSAC
jgi:hypothetical protein